jgi:hypothetical protein
VARTAHDITSVHRLLEIHDDGDKLAEVNEDLTKLIREINDAVSNGAKGTGSITLTFALTHTGKSMDVVITHAVKAPKKQPAKSSYFLGEDGDVLTTRNPHQREMFAGRQMDRGGVTQAG